MYGDVDECPGDNSQTPMSFVDTPHGGEQLPEKQQFHKLQKSPRQLQQARRGEAQQSLLRTKMDRTLPPSGSLTNGNDASHTGHGGGGGKKISALPTRISSQKNNISEESTSPLSPKSPLSPTPSFRDMPAGSSGSQFPMSDMDNPNDIALELSNLQALRRMSMDVVNSSDPDLLPFSGVSLMAMPPIAPTGDDDEGDPSRLLWVPARVHPELEPTAFKSFLENRVQTMKERSGDSAISNDGVQRGSSGLRRKKSMLSRQIDNSGGRAAGDYIDGAKRLHRQSSLREYSTPELSLNDLVKDPSLVVKKLAQETGEGEGDLPILPVAPGMGLRRSTKTTYRRGGSVRSGNIDRGATFSKRIAARQAEGQNDVPEVPLLPTTEPVPPVIPTAKTQSEMIGENFSRSNRSVLWRQNFLQDMDSANPNDDTRTRDAQLKLSSPPPQPPTQHSIRTTCVPVSRAAASNMPQIVETPPPVPAEEPAASPKNPQRLPSQKAVPESSSEQITAIGPPARSIRRLEKLRPGTAPATQYAAKEATSPTHDPGLNSMATDPNPIPGSGSIRTDSLTFIPPYDEKKFGRKSKEHHDNESINSVKSSSSGWKWFKSEKDKKRRDRDKEEDDAEKDPTKLHKAKAQPDRSHDNARLDVLQSSTDTAALKGRQSLLLDRDSADNKPQDERKKETGRKVSDTKKEKEGFFGGLFGGSRKKNDKGSSSSKRELHPLSSSPPVRILRPDIDYSWTRFTIIEERAIYRMAHIKLANPRRPLHSQVLLSNFMYSYLAKVQAMHPQIQVPVSPQQKRLEEERKRREAEQAQSQIEQQVTQHQAAQDENMNFEHHRSVNHYGDPSQHDGSGGLQYMDEAEAYQKNFRNGNANG